MHPTAERLLRLKPAILARFEERARSKPPLLGAEAPALLDEIAAAIEGRACAADVASAPPAPGPLVAVLEEYHVLRTAAIEALETEAPLGPRERDLIIECVATRAVAVAGAAERAREAAERKLAESERRLRQIIEQSPISIQVLSPEGRTLEVNAAWLRLWDVGQELLQGYILSSYNVLEDPQLEAKGILPYLRRGFSGEPVMIPPVYYDPAEIGKVGRAAWVEAHLYPVKDEAGRVREVILVHMDVTDRKRVEEERIRLLAQSRADLERLREERELRERFVATLTHDLRGPLSAVGTSAEALRRRPADDLAARDVHLSRILRQVARADRMIQDLLDASRIRAGKPLPLEVDECDLHALAAGAIEDLKVAHGERFVLRGDGPVVGQWDARALRRVIENLVANAVKYGRPGAPVTVSVHDRGNGFDRVQVSVHNEGEPLTPREQARMFEPFQRGERAAATGERGWGLGLALVRALTEAHGGTVYVESAPPRGTTFTIDLPRDARGAGPAPEREGGAGGSTG